MNHIAAVREITNKEVQLIIGRKEAAARALLKKIRKALGKSKGQIITILEFCNYKGYNVMDICAFLGIRDKATI